MSNIKYIKFFQTQLDDNKIDILFDNIKLSNLEYLKIGRNQSIGIDGYSIIHKIILNSNIKCIELIDNNLSAQCLKSLLSDLKLNKLQTLNLNWNPLLDEES